MMKESVRNRQIDGLRGVMAFIIVLFHLFCRYQQLYCDNSIAFMENWGTYGVCTFFLISGYFLVDNKEGSFKLLPFLKRKVLRLYPMYLICITLTSLVLLIIELPGRKITIEKYVLNILCINGFIDRPYIDGAHWYMIILISTILICGSLKKMKLSKNSMVYVAVLFLSAVCLYLNIPVLSILLGGGYIGIAFCGVAIHQMELEDANNRKSWILLIIISLIFTWKIRGIDFVIGLLIGMPLCWGAIRGYMFFLELSVFQYLEKISFELYLIHQNIAYAIEYKLQSISGTFSYWYPVVSLICVLGLGTVLYETKMIVLTKKEWKYR